MSCGAGLPSCTEREKAGRESCATLCRQPALRGADEFQKLPHTRVAGKLGVAGDFLDGLRAVETVAVKDPVGATHGVDPILGAKPLRSRPTWLRVFTSAGLPSAIMKGSTSWTHFEQAAIMARSPIRQNWCRPAFQPMFTWSPITQWETGDGGVTAHHKVVADHAAMRDVRVGEDMWFFEPSTVNSPSSVPRCTVAYSRKTLSSPTRRPGRCPCISSRASCRRRARRGKPRCARRGTSAPRPSRDGDSTQPSPSVTSRADVGMGADGARSRRVSRRAR